MSKRKTLHSLLAATALVASTFAPFADVHGQTMSNKSIAYPKTAKVSHVDDYAGTKIEDPYRWLEDDRSKETEAWVTAQNRVTFGYLEEIPFRAALRARLGKLYDYPKYTAPSEKRGLYFFRKNTGLQNQAVLYMQKGLNGTPEVLIDPNTLSPDGTTRLGRTVPSKDARFMAYTLSQAGSDWQQIKVMDLTTRKDMSDTVEWVKVSGVSWAGDGFFYSRYDAPKEADKAYSAKNEFHKVYFHKLGTPQTDDRLIFEDKDPKTAQRFHTADTTDDERFLMLNVSDRGTGKDGDAVFVRDLSKNEKTFKPVTDLTFKYQYGVFGNINDKLLVFTNDGAPNSKIILVDAAQPDIKNAKVILPEQSEPLVSASHVGGKIIATYMKDVSHRVRVYDETGKFENEITLPAIGTVGGFGGDKDDKEVFYTFTSFTFPPTIYRYDLATKKSTLFRAPEIKGFDSNAYETKQVFYPSKDGTKIPMFVVHKKGMKLDGQNPTLLYAYGGFNVPLNPSFSSLLLAWLEQGGVYAMANLRGGSEYGEKWHEQGMKERKQTVFDDFIAAAEYLKANKYTSTEKLAIQGGSNGGLLVGAVMTQRPDLVKVALPAVGVMDMLRFHKFTIGYNWAAEYGSADNPAEFAYLVKYSPLHNLKAGMSYPATLITTADHDDRVVPAHSFKFAATLQEKHAGENPVLIRIETNSGHGASNTTKQLDATADVYAFTMYNLGMTPKY
ncbi:MAG: prolyl oligopeptidase family serine peptidase [Pyrinomonadaceae bacterium MAG19_C2-C3]|nr:prolyl oligopeptidase family serine peptidase [Pyrinomonadaceae bacterium MAG19_C2-C3]